MIALEHDSWPRWMVEAVQVLAEAAMFNEDRTFAADVAWTVLDLDTLEPGEGRRLGQVVAYLARLGAIRSVGVCFSTRATARSAGNLKRVWTLNNYQAARALWDGRVRLGTDAVALQGDIL